MPAVFRFTLLGSLALLLVSFSPLTGRAQDNLAAQVLDRINRARADVSLPPLVENAELDAAAQAHADDMLKNGVSLGHRGSDGSNIQQRITRAGYGGGVTGENWAAYRSLDLIFAFWLNDPPHRRNILNANFSQVGIGVAVRPGGGYIVITDFGGAGVARPAKPAQSAAPASKKAKATALPKQTKPTPKPTRVPPTRPPTRRPTAVPTAIQPTAPVPTKVALAQSAPGKTRVLLFARGKRERLQLQGEAVARVGTSAVQMNMSFRWVGGGMAIGGLFLVGVAILGYRRRLLW